MLISLFWTQQPSIKHLVMQKENVQENFVFKAVSELLKQVLIAQ